MICLIEINTSIVSSFGFEYNLHSITFSVFKSEIWRSVQTDFYASNLRSLFSESELSSVILYLGKMFRRGPQKGIAALLMYRYTVEVNCLRKVYNKVCRLDETLFNLKFN